MAVFRGTGIAALNVATRTPNSLGQALGAGRVTLATSGTDTSTALASVIDVAEWTAGAFEGLIVGAISAQCAFNDALAKNACQSWCGGPCEKYNCALQYSGIGGTDMCCDFRCEGDTGIYASNEGDHGGSRGWV